LGRRKAPEVLQICKTVDQLLPEEVAVVIEKLSINRVTEIRKL